MQLPARVFEPEVDFISDSTKGGLLHILCILSSKLFRNLPVMENRIANFADPHRADIYLCFLNTDI